MEKFEEFVSEVGVLVDDEFTLIVDSAKPHSRSAMSMAATDEFQLVCRIRSHFLNSLPQTFVFHTPTLALVLACCRI